MLDLRRVKSVADVSLFERASEHSAKPLLTVIVPVYNEAATIDELLACVFETPAAKQVIVVDDASTDATAEKLESWMGQVTVIHHVTNRGKGTAIRTGLAHAEGVYTLIQDADLEYDARDYAKLLEPLLAGQADVVYGSRYLRDEQTACAGSGDPRTTGRWSICRWGVWLLNRLVRWLYGVRISDEATCYKVFCTDDLRAMDLQCERFEFCPEVTAKACRMGLRIQEVPISYYARTVMAGKKIRWRDGWVAIKTLWRWRKWRPKATLLDHNSQTLAPHRTFGCKTERTSRTVTQSG